MAMTWLPGAARHPQTCASLGLGCAPAAPLHPLLSPDTSGLQAARPGFAPPLFLDLQHGPWADPAPEEGKLLARPTDPLGMRALIQAVKQLKP